MLPLATDVGRPGEDDVGLWARRRLRGGVRVHAGGAPPNDAGWLDVFRSTLVLHGPPSIPATGRRPFRNVEAGGGKARGGWSTEPRSRSTPPGGAWRSRSAPPGGGGRRIGIEGDADADLEVGVGAGALDLAGREGTSGAGRWRLVPASTSRKGPKPNQEDGVEVAAEGDARDVEALVALRREHARLCRRRRGRRCRAPGPGSWTSGTPSRSCPRGRTRGPARCGR